MRLHMVDRDQRTTEAVRDSLGPGGPHQQRSDESRPGRDTERVDILERALGAVEGFGYHLVHSPQVRPGGQLGHDPAVHFVNILGKNHVAKNGARRLDHRRGGLVAAGLETQDQRPTHRSAWRRTITLSTSILTVMKFGTPSTKIGTRRSSLGRMPRSA